MAKNPYEDLGAVLVDDDELPAGAKIDIFGHGNKFLTQEELVRQNDYSDLGAVLVDENDFSDLGAVLVEEELSGNFYEDVKKAIESKARAEADSQIQAEQVARAQDSDPRSWSSDRFKKEAPPPKTIQEKAIYDAMLQEKVAREKEATNKLLPKDLQAPEPTIIEAAKPVPFLRKLQSRIASAWDYTSPEKSGAIYQIAEDTGVPIADVRKHFGEMSREYTRSAGLQAEPTPEQFLDFAMLGMIPVTVSLFGPLEVSKGIAKFAAVKGAADYALLPAAKTVFQALNKDPIRYEVTQLQDLFPDKLKDLGVITEFILYGMGAKKLGDALADPRVAGELAKWRFRILKALGVKQPTALMPLTSEQITEGFGGKVAEAARHSTKVYQAELAKRTTGEKPIEPAAKPEADLAAKPAQETEILRPATEQPKAVEPKVLEELGAKPVAPYEELGAVPVEETKPEVPKPGKKRVKVAFKVPETISEAEAREIFYFEEGDTLDTAILKSLRTEIEQGEAGGRSFTEEMGVIGYSSTFPDYFKNKGYSKSETLSIIQNAIDGKMITPRQDAILRDLTDGLIEERRKEAEYYAKLEAQDSARAQGESAETVESAERLSSEALAPGEAAEPESGEVDLTFEFQEAPKKKEEPPDMFGGEKSYRKPTFGEPKEIKPQEETATPLQEAAAEEKQENLFDNPEKQYRSAQEMGVMEKGEEYGEKKEPFKKEPSGTVQGQADVSPQDAYAKLSKKLGGLESIKSVESPELYKIAKELSGRDIDLNRLRSHLAIFYHMDESYSFIALHKSLFKDWKLMQGLLAHEIGHLFDWLPHEHLRRGNILGRLGVLEAFRKKFLPEYPGAPGPLTDADRKRFRAEAKALAEKKAGQKDLFKEDRAENVFDPDVIIAIWNRVEGNVPPDLMDYVKALDTEGKKKIIKAAMQAKKKGELLTVEGIRKTNNDFRKDPDGWMAIYEDLIRQEIKKRKLWEEEQIKEELKALTRWWHPFNEMADSSYTKYRYSSRELYADFISVLLNAPGKAQELAPNAFQAFFNYIERKPTVLDSILKTQAIIQGGNDELFRAREKDIRAMFQRGRDAYMARQKRYELAKKSPFFWIKNAVWDKNVAMLDKRGEVARTGKAIDPSIDPKYILERRAFLPVIVRSYLELIDKIHEQIVPILDDFSLYMFAKRIAIGDRQQYANPLAHNPKTAQDQLDFMRRSDPEKYAKIENLAGQLEAWFKENIVPLMKDIYTPEQIKMAQESVAYAPFRVTEFMKDYMPSGIIHQEGTLREITEPYTPLMKKAVSMILAAYRNQFKKSSGNFMLENPSFFDLRPAKITQYPGVFHIEQPRESDLGVISWRENGVWQAYHVDRDIANAINGESNDTLMLINHFSNALNKLLLNNIVFRPAWITFNLTFQARNLFRDFFRLWKAHKDFTLPKALALYGKALPHAVARVKNQFDSLINEMYRAGALNITYNDMILGRTDEHSEIEQLMARYDLAKPKEKKLQALPIAGGIIKILDGIRFLGDVIETLPKVAGYQGLREFGNMSPEERSYIVRNLVGTPNFRRGGQVTGISNALMLFANVKKEALRGMYELAAGPEKKQYWRKTFFANILPQLIKYAAILGVFGYGVKEAYEKISEYDNANYWTIPVGKDENNKTVYFRVVQDEDGRFWSALTWKLLNSPENGFGAEDVKQLFTLGAEQFPSISPALNIAGKWADYLRGISPHDDFRGSPIVGDQRMEAGGWYSLEPMLLWTFNQTGLSRFSVYDNLRDQSLAEKFLAVAPVVNSFIKISDYGETEKLREVSQQVRSEKARESLRLGEPATEALKENRGLNELLAQAKTKDEKKKLIRKYLKEAARSSSDPLTRAISSATSNDEKKALFEKSYERFDSVEQLRTYIGELVRGKIMTAAVANEVIRDFGRLTR